jgi:hypothetical protein
VLPTPEHSTSLSPAESLVVADLSLGPTEGHDPDGSPLPDSAEECRSVTAEQPVVALEAARKAWRSRVAARKGSDSCSHPCSSCLQQVTCRLG